MAERKKIQVLPLGDWLGHPMGPEHYGPEEAQFMVDRANRLVQESGNPVQIDYEHRSLDPPADGAPAAGWMYSFTLEEDGIYADTEWTPKAEAYIKAGEYKYISPVVSFNFKDPATGEEVPMELFNAALTNQPFMHDKIKQVVASAVKAAHGEEAFFYANSRITLSNKNGGTMAPEEIVSKAASALGLPEGTKAEDIIAILKKAGEFMALMPGAPEGGGMPADGEGMDAMMTAMRRTIANSKTLDDVASELGVETDKILPTIAAMRDKGEQLSDAEKELADLRAFKADQEVRNLVTDNANRIPPAKREQVSQFARKHGIEAAKAYVAELPETIPDNTQPKKVENGVKVDAERLALARKQGIDPELIKKSFTKSQEA